MKSLARIFWIALLISIPVSVFPNGIEDVNVSPVSFNPSIGQKIKISVQLPCKGLFKLEILDRDTYSLRTLIQESRGGQQEFSWDGKSDNAKIVPDEAYSLRATQQCGSKEFSYFPASIPTITKKTAAGRPCLLRRTWRFCCVLGQGPGA